MAEVMLPFVDEEIDSSDPSGSAMTILMLIIGGGIVFMILKYAQRVGDRLTAATDSVLPTGGSDSDFEVI